MEQANTVASRVAQCIEKTPTTPGAAATLKLMSECPECGGTGWTVIRATRHVRLCACAERRAEEQLRKAVPLRYQRAELSDFPEKLHAAVLVWLEQPSDGLYIAGPVGSGKTHLAAALMLAWLRRKRRALWRSARDLYSLVRESYDLKIQETERELLKEHSEIPLLVLDDLGATGLTDHVRQITLEVLDRRLNELRPTVVTSNWSAPEVGARMDDRIGSRVSALTTITLKGADRRVR